VTTNVSSYVCAFALPFLGFVLLACNKQRDLPSLEEVMREAKGTTIEVRQEIVVHRVNAAGNKEKYIVTALPGFNNRFVLNKFRLNPGALLSVARVERRTHWTGETGFVPIIRIVGDERFRDQDMEVWSILRYDLERRRLEVDPSYLELVADSET
jgi:hypothetical protein